MSENIIYVELCLANVSNDIIRQFDCGHDDFNDFLRNDAIFSSANGDGVTYIAVEENELLRNNITTIYAFATIQTMCLFQEDYNEHLTYCTSVEIKYFVISKRLQKQPAYMIDPNKHYSQILFEMFIQELYELSTKTVGFKSIFLRANDKGYKLYTRKNFINAFDYIVPYSDDDSNNQCVPMILQIQDNLYDIFN